MGNWGMGVLQDDVADDVRIAFEDAIEEGLSVEEAIQRVLDDPPWPFNGPCQADDACMTYMALAALQLQHDILTPDIREKALEAATSEWAIGRWDGAPEDRIAARRKVLQQFKAILERGTCTAEELEQVTYPKEFSLW
jgi:hypothetical protein